MYFRVPLDTRSYANIRKDNRVCCIADRYPSYFEVKGVMVHGRAAYVMDQDAIKWAGAAFLSIPNPVQNLIPRSDLYCVLLDDVASFDFSKIRNKA